MSEEFNDLRKHAAKQQMQTDVMFDMLKAMTPQKKSSVPTELLPLLLQLFPTLTTVYLTARVAGSKEGVSLGLIRHYSGVYN